MLPPVVVAHDLPSPFAATMPGNGDQPPAETVGLAEPVEPLVGPHEYVLGEVLSIGQIPRVVVADRPDQRGVPVVKHSVSGSVAG